MVTWSKLNRALFGLLIVGLISVTDTAIAEVGHDWQLVNPEGPLYNLEDFSVVNDTIYAVGYGGAVLRSDDGGNGWQFLPTGHSAWFRGTDFTDELTGTIVGIEDYAGIILRTTDGGQSWHPQGTSPLARLNSVDFIDTNTGVTVGQGGSIYWTTDGGATWTPQDSGLTKRLFSVHLFDGTNAVAVGDDGVICRTDNAGATWYHPSSNTTERLNAVDFGSAFNGVAVGNYGTLIYSYDGGESWITRVSGTGDELVDLTYRDIGTAVAVGSDGAMIFTINLGLDWNPLVPPEFGGWAAVDFTSAGGILLTGGVDGVWHCDSTWTTWVNSQKGSTSRLESIANATSEIAVAVGSKGTLLRTDDTGLTWTEIRAGCDTRLWGVDFADSEIGMAVGQDGFALRTDDAGLTWTVLTTGSSNLLLDVACIDTDHAVAVGWERTILHTTDGGTTWQDVSVFDPYDFCQAVYFVDNLHGWISTFYGNVFHTDDGGLTWENQISSRLDLQDIYFTDLLNGISVGGVDGNATLLTDDGGLTWSQQPNPESALLYGVAFSDPLTGIAVGTGIFRTVDGGATSPPAPPPPAAAVCLMGEGVALAVGGSGTILRAGPAGPSSVFGGPPRAKVVMRAYPNPFNPRTTVAFSLSQRENVRISIFDLTGHKVRTLAEGFFPAGDHVLEWDGRDNAGRALASGSYLVRLGTDFESRTQKIMLIK